MVNLGVVEQLLNHIDRLALCKTTDKILLAVSGGLDSMVMFHLFRQTGFHIGVAHCNFQLRGSESDDDAAFVEATCRQLGVSCHLTRFNTAEVAKARGISIQMAARDLRYEFFQELTQTNGYDAIATGHHFHDIIESIFLNLIRGTGLDGFRGIASRKGNVIRPLLFATREMIESYADSQGLQWREDASNSSDDYARNFLRHQVLPSFQQMNPSFATGFRRTYERILGAREYALAFIEGIRSAAVEVRGDNSIRIKIAVIRQAPYPAVLLWELIKDKGFNYDHCKQISQDHQPGKLFFSGSHQLVVDRDLYIIEPKAAQNFGASLIERGQRIAGRAPNCLTLDEIAATEFVMAKDSRVAQLDADRLHFPLVWRPWQSGDYFVPLGMRGEKKVSDFLIDVKMPFTDKADVTVIESAGKIVWIVGLRINDHYKVTADTMRVLVIEQGCDGGKK